MDGFLIQSELEKSYNKTKTKKGGKNADYIPFLASVPSDLFGLAVVTASGEIYKIGDTDYDFAIESISKVFTLALVMDQIGKDGIRRKIGTSPTGLPFNSVMALELHNGKPLSPLVNAGAIATTSLVEGGDAEEVWAKVLDIQSQFAAKKLKLSDAVNTSEQDTNFHNRAIAWLLYSAGACYCDPVRAVDVYTRQCSTLINTEDLAVMAGTLANGGINPLTHQRVVKAEHIAPILAEMTMEGFYTSSGDWAYSVGLPGKTGVGGGVFAVVPGKMAIAAFAPPLDEAGNSVRGQAAIAAIAKGLGFNIFSGS